MSYFGNVLTANAHALRLPSDLKDDIELFVAQHQKGSVSSERAPFRRQLDFWAFSFGTALAKSLEPLDGPSSRWGTKFADTRSVQMPERLCELLAVIALSKLGPDHDGIDDPVQIVELGNRLAGAGSPLVVAHLKSADLRVTTLDKALDYAAELKGDAASIPDGSR